MLQVRVIIDTESLIPGLQASRTKYRWQRNNSYLHISPLDVMVRKHEASASALKLEESIAFMKGRAIDVIVGSNQPANAYRMPNRWRSCGRSMTQCDILYSNIVQSSHIQHPLTKSTRNRFKSIILHVCEE